MWNTRARLAGSLGPGASDFSGSGGSRKRAELEALDPRSPIFLRQEIREEERRKGGRGGGQEEKGVSSRCMALSGMQNI